MDGSSRKSKSMPDGSATSRNNLVLDVESPTHDNNDVQILDIHASTRKKNDDGVILLSDEEPEALNSRGDIVRDVAKSVEVDVAPSAIDKTFSRHDIGKKTLECAAANISLADREKKVANISLADPEKKAALKAGIVDRARMPISDLKEKEMAEKKLKYLSIPKGKDCFN